MKLSTRRKLTTGLAIACGVLMLTAMLQRQLGWGTQYTVLPEAPVTPDESLKAPLKESNNTMASELAYDEINQRSLFTQTRTAPSEAIIAPPDPKVDIPKVPLTAQLTGVVITPNRKVALLRSSGGDQSYRLREGMPFPGDLAGWRVTQINARSVVFDGGGQGQVELKLDVAKGSPMAGNNMPQAGFVPQVPGNPPVPPMSDPNKMNANNSAVPMPGMPQPPPPPPSADQAAREAEVQRIIEERRAQMRAEAERMSSGNQ
jgi:Type II secretion system protein C